MKVDCRRLKIGIPAGVLAALLALLSGICAASAHDRLKLAIAQRGLWDTGIPELGQRAGIFAKRGLDLDILWTEGAGESQQALISGSVDIGLAGTLSALGAFAKGAPIRVVDAEATGSADYWYVRADSPIRSINDLGGRTIAYSTVGASTHIFVLALLKQHRVTGKPVATGGPAATLTQVMSGQIDVGWAAPPFGLDAVEQNSIRIIARGSDILAGRRQTIRVHLTTASALAARPDVFARFVQGYRDTIEWMYAGDDALEVYAGFAGISANLARRIRDDFYPKRMLFPDRVSGLKFLVEDAVTFKYLGAPLTGDQLAEMIQIPAPIK